MSFLARLTQHEAFGGVLLILAAIAALIVANSPLEPAYDGMLNAKLSITLNGSGLSKPLILWINDGLMAIFFFLIGLELKREVLDGKLRNPADVALPGFAALGGMIAPALVFTAFNWGNPQTLPGWAIPAATDIAFALGVLALLGKRAPPSLKIFLLTLAILDDLGAILIIAIFYTADLKLEYLGLALIPLAGLLWMNRRGAARIAPFVLLGIVLWVLVLKSGVHATLAGVITALLVPLKDRNGNSPLHQVENGLTLYVSMLIVPLFAFANSGVILGQLSLSDLAAPVPLGVGLGLIVGKQIGVFGIVILLVKTGFARLPDGAGWLHIWGIACLAGIGFTMSLFIGGLSYADQALINQVRLGVLGGSAISALLGFGVLWVASQRR